MKLITRELERRFIQVGCQELLGDDAVIICKFFTPWTSWTWYATEYNPTDRIFFGYVEGFYGEWGYFSLDELESIQGPADLKVERDLYWKEKPVRKVMKDG